MVIALLQGRLGRMNDIEIVSYDKSMESDCIEFEKKCPQGEEFRINFVRDYFHRRAENFKNWKILVAKIEDQLVGTVGVSLKTLELEGKPIKGAFYFDLRVHTAFRRQGIAQQLGWAAKKWSVENGAKYHYLYCVDDNVAMKSISAIVNGVEVGGYDLLIWPVYKYFSQSTVLLENNAKAIHDECVRTNGPYDFYTNPMQEDRLAGYISSYRFNSAGCSLWSNKGILEELIEKIPRRLSLLGWIMRRWPVNVLRLPHVPKRGDVMKSLYVFDLYARDQSDGVSLIQQINNMAIDLGYEYLYIIDPPGKGLVDVLREQVPKVFSPKMRFSLLSHSSELLSKIYVDIRDL